MSNIAEALKEAAQSLETISKNAGKFLDSDGEENMLRHYDQVRGYANSRATVARQALAAHEAAKPGSPMSESNKRALIGGYFEPERDRQAALQLLDHFERVLPRYAAPVALAANVPQYSDLDGLAHELWAVAQLPPGQGITDGVDRIKAVLLAARGLAANVPAGYKLVPVVPTPEMLHCAEMWDDGFPGAWSRALAAAPERCQCGYLMPCSKTVPVGFCRSHVKEKP